MYVMHEMYYFADISRFKTILLHDWLLHDTLATYVLRYYVPTTTTTTTTYISSAINKYLRVAAANKFVQS